MITERYEAVVSNNEDEEQRGRIEVTCPGLMGDEETVLPVWVEPAHDWGWFYVPDVGEQVEIEVITKSDLDEAPGQSILENPVPTWRSKRPPTDVELEDTEDGSEARPIHDDFISTNYAKRRGFTTPWGHVLLFDDTEGDPRIYLTHMGEQLPVGEAPEPEKFTRVEIEPDGSLKVAFLNKHMVHLTTEKGNLRIALDGEPGSEKHTIEFDAETPKVEIKLDEEKHSLLLDGSVPALKVSLAEGDHYLEMSPDILTANLNGGDNAFTMIHDDADTILTLGDAKHSAVQAEVLEEWLNDTYTPAIADMHDNHTHPLTQFIAPLIPLSTVPCIPGGPPAPPSEVPVVPASLEDYDTSITSSHLLFPEG